MKRRRLVVVLAILATPILAVAIYDIALWIALDMDPDFLAIDACLDSGGRWLAERRSCER